MTTNAPKEGTGIVLDYARIVAALLVFYYHVGLFVRLPLSDYGEYAVTTFLLLAIVSAVAFSLAKGGTLDPGRYLAARLWRLLPLYVCLNLVVFGASFLVSSRLNRPFTGTELILSITGLSQYFGYRYLSAVFWFVPFIIQLYVLIAFGDRFIERLRNWWWLPAAFALYWAEILAVAAWPERPREIIRYWTPLFRPTEMLLGVQGALWLTGRMTDRAFAGAFALFAVLGGLLALGALRGKEVLGWELAYNYTMPLIGVGITLGVLGTAWLLARTLGERGAGWRRLLGRATYPFYLIHGIAIASLYHRFGSAPGVWIGYLLCCVVASLVLDAVFAPRRKISHMISSVLPTSAPAAERVNVLGVGLSVIDQTRAREILFDAVQTGRRGYVAVTGVHGVTEAQGDPEFRSILNHALLCTPDGMPMVWMGRARGHREMRRVYGPDLMLNLCEHSVANGFTHFFYGGNTGVAEDLRRTLECRFPGLRVVGTYCPPFRPLNTTEREDLQRLVAELQPDFFWVGLSTPKQERFMAEYLPLLPQAKVFLGVGAAFDLLTGRLRQAPGWMQRNGLEWFYRLSQEPRRLARRYLINNPLFLGRAALQLSGARKYALDDSMSAR